MNEAPRPLVDELERRIHEMEQHAEDAFGPFGALDWWLCVLAGLVLPVILLALYWP